MTRTLESAVAMINADLEACIGVHLSTPPPVFEPLPRPEDPGPEPGAPVERSVGVFDRILFRRAAIEQENERTREAHRRRIADWQQQDEEHRRLCAWIDGINEGTRAGRQEDMEAMLTERLAALAWAKSTEVAFDFGDDSRSLEIDLDLPMIEEMSHRTAAMPARGINIKTSKRSEAERRRDFARLVAGSCFRVAGEAFACLPTVEEVTVSGFTQRPCPATGGTLDVYLISVRIPRESWGRIDFGRLKHIEPEAALGQFDLRIQAERNGGLREIEPHIKANPQTLETP